MNREPVETDPWDSWRMEMRTGEWRGLRVTQTAEDLGTSSQLICGQDRAEGLWTEITRTDEWRRLVNDDPSKSHSVYWLRTGERERSVGSLNK